MSKAKFAIIKEKTPTRIGKWKNGNIVKNEPQNRQPKTK